MGLNAYSGMLTVVTADRLVEVDQPHAPLRVVTIVVLAVGLAGDEPAADQRHHGAEHDAADHAVPAGAVDRSEPDRLLLRPPRATTPSQTCSRPTTSPAHGRGAD